jgi:hypothetical protein
LYQLGLQNAFMATDPRDSVGVVKDPFDWTMHTWDLASSSLRGAPRKHWFMPFTFDHLYGPSFYIYPFVALYFLPT